MHSSTAQRGAGEEESCRQHESRQQPKRGQRPGKLWQWLVPCQAVVLYQDSMQVLLAAFASHLEVLLDGLRQKGFDAFRGEYLRNWLHTDQQVAHLPPQKRSYE